MALVPVSGASSLIDPKTSQFLARDWIDNIDPAIICSEDGDRIRQRYRLALLYFELGGEQWKRCRAEAERTRVKYENIDIRVDEGCPGVPFLDEKNECEWYGMSCGESYDSEEAESFDTYFPLEVLDLQSNNLAGPLFDEIYGFERLQSLSLQDNALVGTISNDLIGNLQNISSIQLQSNMLTGDIPTTGLFQLERLGK